MKALRIILIILIVAAAGYAVYNFVFKQAASGEMKVNESSVKLLSDDTKSVVEIDPTLISSVIGTVLSNIDGAPDIKISNLTALGIDESKHILLGTNQGQIDLSKIQSGQVDASVELVVPLKDSKKFEGIITPFTSNMAKNKLMKCTVLELDMIKIAWDESDLLIVVSEKLTSTDIDNKFSRNGKMLEQKNFVQYLGKAKDVGIWSVAKAEDYKIILDQMKQYPGAAEIMDFSIFDKLVEKITGSVIYSHLVTNFEKGKIVTKIDGYYNASAKKTIYNFSKSFYKNIDAEMVEHLPHDGIALTMLSIDLKSLLLQTIEFLKSDSNLAQRISMGEQMLTAYGLSFEKVLALIEGNFAVSIGNNISNPTVSALVKIGDKSILENDIIKAQLNNLKTSRGTYAVGYGEIAITDNYIGYSNSPKTAEGMAKGDKFESDKTSQYKKDVKNLNAFVNFAFDGIPEVIDMVVMMAGLEQEETDLLYKIRQGIDTVDYFEMKSNLDHAESCLYFKDSKTDSREQFFGMITPIAEGALKVIEKNAAKDK